MRYLLDADTLIDAKNRYYDFDVCPGFWDWIDQQFAAGVVRSVEAIGNELAACADRLAAWAKARPGFFLPPDERTIVSLQQVAGWANTSGFRRAGIAEFVEGGDIYLIAQAHASGDIFVTREVVSQGVKSIKIPVACAALGVRRMSPFDMLKIEHATFVLGTRP
jgi:hypothetical protein